MAVFANFISMLGVVLTGLILLRVVVSWTNPMGGGGFTAFVYQATEWMLAPIRRIFPPMGGLDWSPFIALLLIGLLTRVFIGL
jgi:YggT family protein